MNAATTRNDPLVANRVERKFHVESVRETCEKYFQDTRNRCSILSALRSQTGGLRFFREHLGVKVGNPLFPVLGNAQVSDRIV